MLLSVNSLYTICSIVAKSRSLSREKVPFCFLMFLKTSPEQCVLYFLHTFSFFFPDVPFLSQMHLFWRASWLLEARKTESPVQPYTYRGSILILRVHSPCGETAYKKKAGFKKASDQAICSLPLLVYDTRVVKGAAILSH